jgi:hypothetical protein
LERSLGGKFVNIEGKPARVHILAPKHSHGWKHRDRQPIEPLEISLHSRRRTAMYRNTGGNVGGFVDGQKSVWKKPKLSFPSFPPLILYRQPELPPTFLFHR